MRFKVNSAESRTCTICGTEKSLDLFAKDKKSKYGRRSQCRDCERSNNTRRVMAWKHRNPEKTTATRKRYEAKNAEIEKTRKKAYATKNKDKIRQRVRERNRQYRLDNPLPPRRVRTPEEIEAAKERAREGWKLYNLKESTSLTDGYVRKLITKRMAGVKRADIPDELVKLTRDRMKLQRSNRNGITGN